MLIGIFGTGRNGSTLIQRLLDGIEDAYVHPVEEIFLSAFHDLSKYGKVRNITLKNCINDEINFYKNTLPISLIEKFFGYSLNVLYDYYMVNSEKTKELEKIDFLNLFKNKKYNVSDFVNEYLNGISNYLLPEKEFKHFIFKSIETPYILNFAEVFPNMKFIHLVRNPLSVCASQKRLILNRKKAHLSYFNFDYIISMLEKRWIPHAKSIFELNDHKNHYVLTYEKLVSYPSLEVEKIASWLNLKPPKRSDIQTLFDDGEIKKLGRSFSEGDKKASKEVLDNTFRELNYHNILSPREIELIVLKTKKYMDKFGYKTNQTSKKIILFLKFIKVEKEEFKNVNTFRRFLEAIFGFFYRRLYIFK